VSKSVINIDVQIYEPSITKLSAHDELCRKAESWLNMINCKVVIRDPFKASTNEEPDAIGWRDGVSILIECKNSRADFLADKKKSFRINPDDGMGDWRFYLCPEGVITESDLPEGWGLLYAREKSIKKVCGFPANTGWHNHPFVSNKNDENRMLVSALRRLSLRGYLPEIYSGIPIKCPECNSIANM
jgi:hypothetical protein